MNKTFALAKSSRLQVRDPLLLCPFSEYPSSFLLAQRDMQPESALSCNKYGTSADYLLDLRATLVFQAPETTLVALRARCTL